MNTNNEEDYISHNVDTTNEINEERNTGEEVNITVPGDEMNIEDNTEIQDPTDSDNEPINLESLTENVLGTYSTNNPLEEMSDEIYTFHQNNEAVANKDNIHEYVSITVDPIEDFNEEILSDEQSNAHITNDVIAAEEALVITQNPIEEISSEFPILGSFNHGVDEDSTNEKDDTNVNTENPLNKLINNIFSIGLYRHDTIHAENSGEDPIEGLINEIYSISSNNHEHDDQTEITLSEEFLDSLKRDMNGPGNFLL